MKWYQISPFIFQKLIWIPTRLILYLFTGLEVHGLEKLKTIKTNAIFAMNHSSEVDPFLVPASLPMWSRFAPLFYATKERSFYSNSGWRRYLFGGLFINLWGGYTVPSGLHDYEKSLKDHIRIIKNKGSFCIFPEGGITDDGSLKRARGGIAYLAESGNCPIIPVAVTGAYKMSLGSFFMGKRKIIINFGLPIYLNNIKIPIKADLNRYQAGAQYVLDKIGDLINKGYESEHETAMETVPSSL